MAYQINLTGQEIDERLQNIGTAEDVAAADGTLYARISKNADDIDELRDAVGHIDSAQTATGKTVTQHTADISALQTALKTKANLTNGKVSANELPIATSLGNPNNDTIPSTFAVSKAINDKIVGLLHWRGVKDTTDEIKAIAPAKKGDVYHSNGDGSEWVCTQDITAANADAWTELGTPIDLGGYYTKTEVDKKVKPLADSIGTDNDAASANGSLYARIKKNAADIATKANQSDINGALILNLTTASTEAEIRKAFTEVNTKTVLFPTPGSIISKLDGNNKGIVVSLSEPDATTLGRTITVYHGNDTYAIIVKSDFTKVLMPWTEIHDSKKIYDGELLLGLGDTTDVAKIKKAFTPKGYAQPVIPDSGDIAQDPGGGLIVFSIVQEDEFAIFLYSPRTVNTIIALQCRKDFTSARTVISFTRMVAYCYDGNALLDTEITTPSDIELMYTPKDVAYGYKSPYGAEPPIIGDIIIMPTKTSENVARGIVVDAVETNNTYITRWFYGGKLYEAEVTKDFTGIPKYGKVIYDTTSGTLRDLYISAGAVYNERTGFYELNGLTDITEEQMRVIYEKTWGWWLHLPSLSGFGTALPRTNIPCPDYKIIAYTSNINLSSIFALSGNDDNLEVVNLRALYAPTGFDEIKIVDFDWAFQGNKKIREVQGIINVNEARYTLNIGGNIETINIKGLKVSIRFYGSQRLSKESVLYMINNSTATSAITISLNKAVYDVMKDDADIIAALAEKTNITLIQNT